MAAIRTLFGLIAIFSVIYGVETLVQTSACQSYLDYSVGWGQLICW